MFSGTPNSNNKEAAYFNVQSLDCLAKSKSHTAYGTLQSLTDSNSEAIKKPSYKVKENETQSQEVIQYGEKESPSLQSSSLPIVNANTFLSLAAGQEAPAVHKRTILIGTEELKVANLERSNDLKPKIEHSREVGSAITHTTQTQVHLKHLSLSSKVLLSFCHELFLGNYLVCKGSKL